MAVFGVRNGTIKFVKAWCSDSGLCMVGGGIFEWKVLTVCIEESLLNQGMQGSDKELTLNWDQDLCSGLASISTCFAALTI